MPPTLAGETTYQRDYRVGAYLKKLVDVHPGACLMVIHHIRKAATEGDWMDSTSGTNGLNGAADWTLNLHRPRGETSGVVRITGRDVPEGEYAVTCDSGSWALDGATLVEAAQRYERERVTRDLGDRSAEIVAFVMAHGSPVAPKDVEAALGLPDATSLDWPSRDASPRWDGACIPLSPLSLVSQRKGLLIHPPCHVWNNMGQRDSGDRGTGRRTTSTWLRRPPPSRPRPTTTRATPLPCARWGCGHEACRGGWG